MGPERKDPTGTRKAVGTRARSEGEGPPALQPIVDTRCQHTHAEQPAAIALTVY